jgi:threonine 3-dehydrogenase
MSGSCEGIHMPSSAWAVAAPSSMVASKVWRIGLRRIRIGGSGSGHRRAREYNCAPLPHHSGRTRHDDDEGAGEARSRQGHLDGTGPRADPGPERSLIRLEKTAICGTDLHIYLWDEWSQRTIKPGLVIGHEFVGRIVDLGPGVTGYKIGQRVSAEGHIVCGHCRNCRAGRQHLCPNTVGIGVNRNGAFAEFIVMPASNLWPIPDQIPSELARSSTPYGNAAHCALEFDVVGEDVLITGAGPIGIIAAGICKHIGARNVVVTDVNDFRLKLAADMGATRVVNVANTSLKDVMADLHMEGFDVGLEMSGNPRAFNDMLDCMYHGGKIAMLGIMPKGAGADWDKIIFKGLTLHGIYGRRMYETWYKMTQLVLERFPARQGAHAPVADRFVPGRLRADGIGQGRQGRAELELTPCP